MWTPYIFAGGNPVKYVDVYGMGPGDRIKYAKSKLGTKYKQQTDFDLRTKETAAALQYMDCSELVSRILADDGFTKGVKHMSTSTLLDWFPSNGWSAVTEPQAGDVIVWNGHTALVESYNSETKKVSVLHATKYGTVDEVVSEKYKTSYYDGKGAIFYRPDKDMPDGEGGGTTAEPALGPSTPSNLLTYQFMKWIYPERVEPQQMMKPITTSPTRTQEKALTMSTRKVQPVKL
jgi:hypothetical protein